MRKAGRTARAVCGEPGCPRLLEPGARGKCSEHAEKPWAMSERRSELPKDWERRRRRILRRDGGLCVKCGALATDVDHIGDRFDHREPNLQSLCTRCHREKTAREASEARREARL